MPPYSNAEDEEKIVKKLENLLNTKVIDRFIEESERYIKLGYNLSELSSKYKLKHDL